MSMPEPGRRRFDFLAYGAAAQEAVAPISSPGKGEPSLPGRRNTRGPLRSPPPPPPYAPAPNSEARVIYGRQPLPRCRAAACR